MLPADGNGTPAMPATSRLAHALERIAQALVRRAEAEAAARDRLEHEPPIPSERGTGGALDHETVEELRHRVDAAILLVRATLGEA